MKRETEMKIRTLLLFCVAAAAAPSAFARYDGEECWNPRANHFEAVRPGERQDDLDFRVCRPKYTGQGRPDWHAGERECWNPRAGHFERVRPGERQDDLNFRHCRPAGYNSQYGGGYRGDKYRDDRYRDDRYRNDRGSECWNPRAGHYEGVRPGERQDDLDFSRCRPKR